MTVSTLLETALDDAGIAVAVILDPCGAERAVLGHVNAPFARLMRQPRTELEGMLVTGLKRFIPSPNQWSALEAALAARASVELEFALQVGGRESWLCLGLTFPQQTVYAPHAVMTGRDITAKHQAAQQQESSWRLMAAIFSRINAAVAIVQANGQIMMVNPAFHKLLGYTMDEVQALRVEDLTDPADGARAQAARAQQLVDGQCYEMCLAVLAKGNLPIPVHITSMLLHDGDQRLRVVTLLPTSASLAQWTLDSAAIARDRGELRAVNLVAFRTLFGDGWERIALRAMMKADQIIRRRLRPEDVVSRVGDHSFVVWFDRVDPEQNAEVLSRAVREIRLRFLTDFGEDAAAHVSATVTAAQSAANSAARHVMSGHNSKPMPTANVFQNMLSSRQKQR